MTDYTDDAFDGGDGYYLVTYGGAPAPVGPFPDIPALAEATRLTDYPANGYVVHFDAASRVVGSVPSLNPDDLYDPTRPRQET